MKRASRPPKATRPMGTEDDAEKAAKAIDGVLTTPAGRELFKYLCKTLGFFERSIVVAPDGTGVREDFSLFNETRRDYYLQLRNLASPELLVPVESAVDKARRVGPVVVKKEQGGVNG